MAVRALLTATVTDQAGNAVQNALVRVYLVGTTTPVDDMFAAASGGSPITDLTSDNRGQIVGWFDDQKFVDLLVTDNGHAAFRPNASQILLTFIEYTKTVPVEPDVALYLLQTDLDAEAILRVAGDAASVSTAATDATTKANAAQVAAVQRANHTGTQSADTLTDGTTNKAFLATERTKLAGVATGATANDTDANLKARANHTGTQLASTVSDFDTQVATTAVLKALFDANTVLAANSDNTPAALTMGASTILARLAAGNIKAATPAELKTLLAIAVADISDIAANYEPLSVLQSVTATTATTPVSVSSGRAVKLTLNATTTLAITWGAGVQRVRLITVQDATGGRVLTISGATWLPAAPAVRTGPNVVEEYDLFTPDGGTTVYGVLLSGPRGELDYKPWTTDSTSTNTTYASASANKISGVSSTVTGSGRPVTIEVQCLVYHSVANGPVFPTILIDGEEADGIYAASSSPSTSAARTAAVRLRKVLTAGQSYTFEVGKWSDTAGTQHYYADSANPGYLRVIEV